MQLQTVDTLTYSEQIAVSSLSNVVEFEGVALRFATHPQLGQVIFVDTLGDAKGIIHH